MTLRATSRHEAASPRQRRRAIVLVWAAALLLPSVAGRAQAAQDPLDEDGFYWTPSGFWKKGIGVSISWWEPATE